MQNNLLIFQGQVDAIKYIFRSDGLDDLNLKECGMWLGIEAPGTILYSEDKELIRQAFEELTIKSEVL